MKEKKKKNDTGGKKIIMERTRPKKRGVKRIESKRKKGKRKKQKRVD